MKKNLPLFNLITLVSSLAFAFLQMSFSFDTSLIAFPLALAFIIWMGYIFYFKFCINLHPLCTELRAEKLSYVTKLLQYLPYILLAAFVFRRTGGSYTSHWMDIIAVLLWLVASIFSRLELFILNTKRFYKYFPELESKNTQKKKNTAKKVLYEVFDWVDAFVQAICTVALFNIFIFQLYEIPSESMVSEFLVRDRVVGWKLDAGPKFPLSDVGVPELKNYERGDIVIFSNPHYSSDRDAQVKSFLSQLVYMLSLTTVNLNVDEDGNLKADPLVKRIVGEEGEQLVMQDGILYARTKDNSSFEQVKEDEIWAEWNLNELPQKTLSKVQRIPLSQEEYEIMLEVEENRRNLDIEQAESEAQQLAQDFTQIKESTKNSYTKTVTTSDFNTNNDLHVYRFFALSDDLIRTLFYSEGGEDWFSAYMTDWTSIIPSIENGFIGGDVYTEAMYKQNLMLKLNFGRLAVRTAELLSMKVSTNDQNRDFERMQILQDFQNAAFYMITLNDMRNMEVFPPNLEDGEAQYISKDNFFVMGDNRFNSLDMRHSYDTKLKAVTQYDKWSLHYDSNLSPQQISTDNILGSPILRFYPFNRFDIIKNGVDN